MKKIDIVNLIKFHKDGNEQAFKTLAFDFVNEFANSDDKELADYIVSLMSDNNVFNTQKLSIKTKFFTRIDVNSDGSPLPLPDAINSDIKGLIHAVNKNVELHKFLFSGSAGTGKSETVKVIAKLMNLNLYMINFDSLIDSKLGQTIKNIAEMQKEMNDIARLNKTIFLIDEIDAIALDRTNQQDLREMGRATSSMLKLLDETSMNAIIIATTNLIDKMDKALVRRFDAIIDFNRYSREDLLLISEKLYLYYATRYKIEIQNLSLFRKIINMISDLPYPGELKNIIRMSIAFSDNSIENDHIKQLFKYVNSNYLHFNLKDKMDLKRIYSYGLSTRDIEIISDISKSTIARELKET